MSEVFMQHGNHEARCQCDDCGTVTRFGDLDMITDFEERVSPGEIVPAGQCPECGALAHFETPEDWSIEHRAKLMRDAIEELLDNRQHLDLDPADRAMLLKAVQRLR